jgi:hypothetical protein
LSVLVPSLMTAVSSAAAFQMSAPPPAPMSALRIGPAAAQPTTMRIAVAAMMYRLT